MRIRVLIWQMPQILRDIITRTLAQEVDMEVIAPKDTAMPFAEAVSRYAPSTVVTSLEHVRDNELEQTCTALLMGHPQLRVLAVRDEGRNAILYKLNLHSMSFNELSPDALVNLVRGLDSVYPG